jgi:hypothetical protein
MTALRRVCLLLLGALAIVGVAGCGVPQGGQVRAIDGDMVPYGLLSPAPTESSSSPTPGSDVTTPQVFFLNSEEQLVGLKQSLEPAGLEPVVSALLARLVAGPTEQERDEGIASALGPDVKLKLVGVKDRLALIEVTPSTNAPTADRLPLAIGQIVLTVTSVDGVDRVQLFRQGAAIEAVLPGGERTSEPVSASDYMSLLAPTAFRLEKAEPGPSPSLSATASPAPSPD